MGLLLTTAGPYAGAYNSADCGLTEDGYNLSMQEGGETINMSDAYGDTWIETVYRGGSVNMEFICLEYRNATVKNILHPYAAIGTLGAIGSLASTVGSSMVLTARAGLPAAQVSPATLTAFQTLIAPGWNWRLIFTSKLRRVPIRLAVFVTSQGGNIVWFTMVG